MEQEPDSEASCEPNQTPDVFELLANLNHDLERHLRTMQALKPRLTESLHDSDQLPDKKTLAQAALAVNHLHGIQVLLDPPLLILADHFLGYVKSKCLLAAVDRGVPDALETQPLTLDGLAQATRSRSDRLGQILRILCNSGIFAFEESTGHYSNTPASSLLKSDHWTHWQNWVKLYGNQFYDIARGIPASVHQDSKRWAAQVNYDTDDNMFTFFNQQGWVPELHQTLGGGAAAQMPGILADYPWEEISHDIVMDVGGGSGAFIADLVRKYPTMRGGIYDLPHIIDHVRPFFRSSGHFSDVQDQIRDEDLIAGDFFESVPARTVYTMKWCLHDWKDKQAVLILKNIRQSIVLKPNSRLVVLEAILSDGQSDRLSQYADINMMMTADGQERTEAQWRALAKRSGWQIEGIYELRRAWVKAMDFRPVLTGPQDTGEVAGS